MVESLEANTHRSCPRADTDKADTFNNPFTRLGDDRESYGDVWTLAYCSGCPILTGGDGPFGKNAIHVFGNPPSNLVD